MPFLIDGHNVIGKLPDIALDDPHDEVKLVLKLRVWASRKRRKATVVFDSGLPGGYSRELSGGGLEVVFAARGHTIADRIIMERLRYLPDAANWTVVSSDREVLAAARRAGARTLTAQEFVKQLAPTPRISWQRREEVSEEEVAEWLELFSREKPHSALGEVGEWPEQERDVSPETPHPPARQKQSWAAHPPSGHTQRPLGELAGLTLPAEGVETKLVKSPKGKPDQASPAEVEEWLEIFGDGAAEVPPVEFRPNAERQQRELAMGKENPEALSPAEVNDWLQLFERHTVDRGVAPPEKQATAPVQRSQKLQAHKRQQQGDKHKVEGLDAAELEEWYQLFGKEPDF
ncbi:MAG TPA: NYN domain-containing protein [Thermoflexia bacterium]|nr:NYN domain-containing protein [Thermoflexia bacterium]